jgi:hypothetical protein
MREHHRSDDPDVIERDLRETRARVDRTIDQIQDRLSPGQLLDEGLRYFRDGPTDYLATFGSNLSHSVRDNPLPVAMIGLGFAWLALGQGTSTHAANNGSYRRSWTESGTSMSESSAERARAAADRLKRNADETQEAFEHRRQQAMAKILEVKEDASESLEDLRKRVAAAMDEASARWEEMKDSVRRRSHDIRDSASHGMAQARDAVSGSWSSAGRMSDSAVEIFERQPLLAAAAGVTVGALLGSLFPTTERENEALGPHREELKRRTEALGKEAMHTAKEAGRAAADAGLHEVDRAMGEAEDRARGEDRASGEDRPSFATEHQRHIGGAGGGGAGGGGGATTGGITGGPPGSGQRPL